MTLHGKKYLKADNWDVLEQLPENCSITKDKRAGQLGYSIVESLPFESTPPKYYFGNTPADALKAYWDSKK